MGCVKRRSTFTTTVLAFLSLTTTPWSTRFGISRSFYPSDSLAAPLAQNRFDTGNFPAQHPHAAGVLKLSIRPLKAQVELLLLELRDLVAQLVGRLRPDVV